MGLIMALVAAVGWLARFAAKAHEDVKADRDEWRAMARESTDNVAGLTAALVKVVPELAPLLEGRGPVRRARA